MHQVVIENPIINTPFAEPTRHFHFTEEGITDQIDEGRRPSSYFIPIAQPKKNRGKQLVLPGTEWTQDRIEENRFVNAVRARVKAWRQRGYPEVTHTTRELLSYWTDPEREKKLFFCQIEALETAIYITEVAKQAGDVWMHSSLQTANENANPGLFRMAFKMATGTGKTVVMGMLMAWQALNKLANTKDIRFSDAFLLVAPGITIRDRLRVLLPNDPANYYRQRDLLPPHLLERLGQAKIVIINYHAFQLREKIKVGKLTKTIATQGQEGVFTETPDQMARRVCRELGNKKHIIVINDEAHHCYRRKPDAETEKLDAEERAEAKTREEEARVWISGLEAIKAKIGVRCIYDLSATPFFLKGSGNPEGTLFPWVVSDFSLIDAIESGLVKIPRVPVEDNSMAGNQPTYRELWYRIREELPRKGRKTEAVGGEPKLPLELQGALHSLYGNYEKWYRQWEENAEAKARGLTPPVFIVVCNNTNVSKMVYDYIAGWEKDFGSEKRAQAGQLPIFRNDDGNGGWLHRPNTILVDSEQIESGEAMSADFKKIAARQIDEFKEEYKVRFPGRDADNLTDEDLLREVMNTVGKAGKLGEHVKCVISVSMLTEGWDANTVTHILGVRAFGTQLLCEQVVGRALRRISYSVNETGFFDAEYAEVYGVPFSFIPCSGSAQGPKPGPMPTRVRALESRESSRITFPRLAGYRYELPGEHLTASFTDRSTMTLSTKDMPTKTENAPIVGESSIHTLDELKEHRMNEVAFKLARYMLEQYFRDAEGQSQPWLFPTLVSIVKEWLGSHVICHDNTFPQLLLLTQHAANAAERIYQAIVRGQLGTVRLQPLMQAYDPTGSTDYVDFDTRRAVYPTKANKCHISHVVADTGTWEQKLAQSLEDEDMPQVLRYVKNHNLGFTIPYTHNGESRNYHPDFIVCLDDGHGQDDPLHLILEVTGEMKKDKEAKTATAQTLWVPAVNNHGGFGRWAFIEITDPWNAKQAINAVLAKRNKDVSHG